MRCVILAAAVCALLGCSQGPQGPAGPPGLQANADQSFEVTIEREG
jgi:hypothetical protein